MLVAERNLPLLLIMSMERELEKRKEQALVATSLSVATLIVCFSIAYAMI